MLMPVTKVTVIARQQLDARHWKVQARIENACQRTVQVYYLRIEDRVVKIEWEATVGHWSMPVKTYLALGTKEDIIARVFAQINNYYNCSFRETEGRFQSVRLHAGSGDILHGYIQRSGPAYEQLMTILADGNLHAITVSIRNVAEFDMPLITGVLSRTWILSEES
jgi:hypothetical protein